LIVGGTFASGTIAVAVIAAVVGLAFWGRPIPDVLTNWGGIIIGFYFGQFLSLAKDYMHLIGRRESGANWYAVADSHGAMGYPGTEGEA
jgi:hypothetical protein